MLWLRGCTHSFWEKTEVEVGNCPEFEKPIQLSKKCGYYCCEYLGKLIPLLRVHMI